MRLRFLGTGASGGTPGRGRSRRSESSLLVSAGRFTVLIDVTRDFRRQASAIERIDAVLLTHGHRDASGGVAALRSWWRERELEPIPVYASAATIRAVRRRHARLDHCRLIAVGEGGRRRLGPFTVTARRVPHAREPRFPTFAWRLGSGGKALVYASDVARPTAGLERFSAGASLLVIDGAMWRRRIFSHLTIDADLPRICGWDVNRILLTQIGRSAPLHERLAREVRAICPRAVPAYDGLELRL
jgi:ribonuclease BN (tRNA processing enzyme)